MKAKLVELSEGDPSPLELPSVSRAYERYSSLVRRKGAGRASFREWLRGLRG